MCVSVYCFFFLLWHLHSYTRLVYTQMRYFFVCACMRMNINAHMHVSVCVCVFCCCCCCCCCGCCYILSLTKFVDYFVPFFRTSHAIEPYNVFIGQWWCCCCCCSFFFFFSALSLYIIMVILTFRYTRILAFCFCCCTVI